MWGLCNGQADAHNDSLLQGERIHQWAKILMYKAIR